MRKQSGLLSGDPIDDARAGVPTLWNKVQNGAILAAEMNEAKAGILFPQAQADRLCAGGIHIPSTKFQLYADH